MIPVFEATLDGLESGIYTISLVDLPAVESDFVAFDKQKQVMKYAIENEEQRMVTGVIMRANFNIYRYDKNLGEFYIKYSPATIKAMAEKMMIDNTFNNINIMHEDGSYVKGVNLVELFIKNTEKGINPANFDDIEDGSLFATYKINNDEIWEQIKLGAFKGFSLEGIFGIEKINTEMNKNTEKYSSDMNKNTEKNNTFTNMITKLFNKFLKSFIKCGSMTTVDDKEFYWVGEADLQVGDELFYNADGEEAIKVEDGEYELKDGTKITVKEGVVSEIVEADGEKENSLDNEVEVEAEEETKPEETETPAEQEPNEIDELKAEIEGIKASIDEIKATLETLLAKPAGEPIVEEFKKMTKQEGSIPVFGSRSRLVHD